MKKLLGLAGGLILISACGSAPDAGSSVDDGSVGKASGNPVGAGGGSTTGGNQGNGGALATTTSGTGSTSGSGTPEVCGDGLDNDGNGLVDDGCSCEVGKTQACFAGDPKLAGHGPCALGTQTCAKVVGQGEFNTTAWGACEGSGEPTPETCNGKDDDCNGVVDDGCDCKDGDTQACSTKCGDGQQSCQGGKWSECDAPKPNANGSCNQKVNINVDGDCVCAPACPANVPFVVGCQIDFQGGNANGCVATAKNGQVYFQEGVNCDAGHLTGFIICSDQPGAPLDENNCPINKSSPHYGQKPSDCPDISKGSPDGCYY